MDNKIEATKKFNQIRDIPYHIPVSLSEMDCCCSGKHLSLNHELNKLGYENRYRVVSFKWGDMKLPEELLKLPHQDESTHVYLEVKIGDAWKDVDATWDSKLSAKFHINEWDRESGTKIAVPVIEKFSLKKSHEIMTNQSKKEIENDLKINGEFYKALNAWLEGIRKNDD